MNFIEDRILVEGAWTTLRETRYIDDRGAERTWTYVARTGNQSAVVIVPVTEETGSLLLIRQFRIPFRRDIIEFPAGLIDPGEGARDAALRELREETGHDGTIVSLGPPVSTSAGMTTETISMAYMRVTERPVAPQTLEGSERIAVEIVHPRDFSAFIDRETSRETLFDAKVWIYLTQASGLTPASGR